MLFERLFSITMFCSVLLSTQLVEPAAIAPSHLSLDSHQWTLIIDHDFKNGDLKGLYTPFCGTQGDQTGSEINNFSTQNVFWQNGTLVLKFEHRTNTSCTGVTRDYAGAGFVVNLPELPPSEIAAEFEIKGTDIYGVSPYTTLWPVSNAHPLCGWGAEDDFFEQDAQEFSHEIQTYHYWTPAPECGHHTSQISENILDIANNYHRYGVIRDGGAMFFVDGLSKTFESMNTKNSDNFMNFPMTVQMGIGGNRAAIPNEQLLPAFVYVQHIKVWKKNNKSD